jgi:hypothetical protein
VKRAGQLALFLFVSFAGEQIAAAPLPRDATQDQENQWQHQLVDAFLAELQTTTGHERIYWRPPSGGRERIARARLARLLAGCRLASTGQTVNYGPVPPTHRGERGVGIWMAFTCTGADAPAAVLAVDFGFTRRGLRRVSVSTDTDLHAYCQGTPPDCQVRMPDLPIAPPASGS